MRRVLPWLVLASALVPAGCDPHPAAIANRLPVIGGTDTLPASGTVPGLEIKERPRIYRGNRMEDYLGQMAGLFINYGASRLTVADYTLGGPERLLTVECFTMESDVAAAGIFHYYRGDRLRGKGRPVDAGAEAVVDVQRGGRNLYLYQQRLFYKLIYSGPEPIPDLLPLARAISAAGPGTQERPKGFAYLDLPGIRAETAHVTPGFTFNADFLPPGIFANAPGAGPIAEVFLIGHNDRSEAAKTGKKYRNYLELNGLDYALKYTGDRRLVWKARDPEQGRLICTVHDKFLIGVLRPQDYETGERMLDRIVQAMERR